MRFVLLGDLQDRLTNVFLSGIFMRSLQRLRHLCLQREIVGYLTYVLVHDLPPWSSSLAVHTWELLDMLIREHRPHLEILRGD